MDLAITGHRPPKLGGYRPNNIHAYVRQKIDEHYMKLQPSRVICGMAQGVDFIAAELCVQNDIPFIAAIPTRGFESRWPPPTQEQFRYLVSKAESTEYIAQEYTREVTRQRNRWRLEHCDALLAVWDGQQEGGTWMTINMARHAGKAIYYEVLPQQTVLLARQLWAREQDCKEQARVDMEARHGRPHMIPPGSLQAPPLIGGERIAEGLYNRQPRRQPVRTPTVEELFRQINDRIERGESLGSALQTVGDDAAADLAAQIIDDHRAVLTGAQARATAQVSAREDRDRFVPRRRIDVGEDE
jgi:uncharacterized phage-like protein YoqJ